MIIRRLSNLKTSFSKYTSKSKEYFQLPEKWKGGRIERWSEFWKALCTDYIIVTKETIRESRNKPRKAIIISSGLGILFAALKLNPDEQSFYDKKTKCINELAMVGDSIRNPVAENHILYLNRSQNQGLLCKTDLIFCSLMWEADYNFNCNLYSSQCKYLRPQILTFYQRIVDVGLFNTWLNLKIKMRDFDINPNEWIEKV